MERPLNELNADILEAERKAKSDIAKIEAMQERYPEVNFTVDDKSTIANYVRNATGIYKYPEYVSELEAYTARFHAKFVLWYAVRDNFYDIYFFANAEVKKDIIIFNNGGKSYLPINKEDVEIIKECQNGNVYVKSSPLLLECVALAKKLVELSR